MKKIVYVDMDNVIVDFQSGINQLDENTLEKYKDNLDEVPGLFGLRPPMPGALDALTELNESNKYDLYLLSTAPWLNSSAWIDKLQWVHRYIGKEKGSLLYKRLIITHHKNLNAGHYLIDDRPNNGAKDFTGEWIHFGSDLFPDWPSVLAYLC